MNRASNKLVTFAAGLAWATLASVAAADDTELFVGNALSGSQAKPNILFILDDSISMGPPADVITQSNYNPATVYPVLGFCTAARVFWSTTGTLPPCTSNNYFNMTALMCKRALDAFNAAQGGVYAARMAQFNGTNQWIAISATQKTRPVECQPDRPDASIGWSGHGSVAAPIPNVYARNSAAPNNWSSTLAQEVSWPSTGAAYTLYSGNYLNWVYSPGNLQERIVVMREVATNLINAIDGVNVGLMHFNDFSGGLPGNDGAEVLHAMQDVTTARTVAPTILTAINSLQPVNSTPLEESLYEAYLYMTGKPVNYGTGADPDAYVAGNPALYESPMDLECQKNHIVLLTDGEPRDDTSVSASIQGLVDAAGDSFADHIGSTQCDLETYPPGFVGPPNTPDIYGGHCLDELAEFMYEGDHSPLNGGQNVTTHVVGFRVDTSMLQQTAARGGGQYYTANNTAELTNALLSIITSVLDTQTTFLAPAVSVNNFNQTRNLDDLYFSVFRPTATAHWPGNLKKYKLRGSDGTIVDALDNPAIDPATGFFAVTARSIWSAAVDGEEVELGGAANLIPAARKVYTFLGNQDLTAVTNAVIAGNPAITDAMVNVATPAERTAVFGFINGLDTADIDQDGVTGEPRYQMGDPLHAQPISVVYGPASTDARIYFATNDGFLHSIHANTGIEQWAFVPQEFLDNQISFYRDIQVGTGSKTYGVDGNMRVQFVNANSDGVVGPGEKVFLFVSMRRGGDVFYALDITNPSLPRVMWKKDGTTPATTLPGIGQGFSSAMPARILVGSGAGQNADRTVVVIGGGYDTTQDNYTANTDNLGNSIYIVDSENGTLLWHGSGNAGADKVFQMSPVNPNRGMNYSIPGDIRVLDLNGDQLADRMYAADQGGQVWRFDIRNGPLPPGASFIDGGIIAQLGSAGIASPTLADTRRFYYAPDVALASTNEFSFLHIGIGSGYREHPNEVDNHNAFYALRDYKTFASMTQAEYDAVVPTRPGDVDFINVTASATASVPQGMKGWYLDLTAGGGWNGEKVMAETRTFNNRVFVTTFRPGTSGNSCTPQLGTNRQYVMSLFTGAPVNNRDGSPPGPLTTTDRYTEWEGAPPPETIFIYTNDGVNSCVGTECGLEDFPDSPIRTFWSQESIE